MEKLKPKIVIPATSIDDARSVRRTVFQLGQGIAEDIDFDGLDESAIHIVAYSDGKPIGTARIRNLEDGAAKIERVAVLAEYREHKVGSLIMDGIHSYLEQNGTQRTTLDAQAYIKRFYEKLGYSQEGDEFDEAGIPHVKMTKRF